MSRLEQRAKQMLSLLGLEPWRGRRFLAEMPGFARQAMAYRRANPDGHFPLSLSSLYPMLGDASDDAGVAKGGYFHQDLWAARKIFARRPARHVDIGSRIDGFVAHLLVFMPVEVIDIRALASPIPDLSFIQEDATELRRIADDTVDSISTLHAVEHFGLGRYGDPIDPHGWRKATAALARVLAPGGRLYFSVPVGRERLVFNAHRVFSPKTILEGLAPLRLISFSAVDDAGAFLPDADPTAAASMHCGVGLFELTK